MRCCEYGPRITTLSIKAVDIECSNSDCSVLYYAGRRSTECRGAESQGAILRQKREGSSIDNGI
jgi:hypothetical protein